MSAGPLTTYGAELIPEFARLTPQLIGTAIMAGGGQKGGYPFYFDDAAAERISRKKYRTLKKSKPKGMRMKTWVQMNQKKKKPKRSKKKATKKRRQRGGAYLTDEQKDEEKLEKAKYKKHEKKQKEAHERGKELDQLEEMGYPSRQWKKGGKKVEDPSVVDAVAAALDAATAAIPRSKLKSSNKRVTYADKLMMGRVEWPGKPGELERAKAAGSTVGNTIISPTRTHDIYGAGRGRVLSPIEISEKDKTDRGALKRKCRERGIFFNKGDSVDTLLQKIREYNDYRRLRPDPSTLPHGWQQIVNADTGVTYLNTLTKDVVKDRPTEPVGPGVDPHASAMRRGASKAKRRGAIAAVLGGSGAGWPPEGGLAGQPRAKRSGAIAAVLGGSGAGWPPEGVPQGLAGHPRAAAIDAESDSIAQLNSELYTAAEKGDAEAIKRLAGDGARVNAKGERGTPAVWIAAYRGHADALLALAGLGADLNATDRYGRTALMAAALMDKKVCMVILVARGADPTIRNARGETALEIAERELRRSDVPTEKAEEMRQELRLVLGPPPQGLPR
mgnify:CR=1 FL=1